MTRPMLRTSLPFALAVALLASACGGGPTNVDTSTEGQQLMDLRSALESGAITEEEYERERREILRD